MILECQACHAKYLVQIGIFAQGGRQVRCARCKHVWFADLPNNVEVFAPIPAVPPPMLSTSPASAYSNPAAENEEGNVPSAVSEAFAELRETVAANLPMVVKNFEWKRNLLRAVGWSIVITAFLAWPILDRQQIAEVVPQVRGIYQFFGLEIHNSYGGLIFDQVKSELRYDGGTMRLYVDGVIHNMTSDAQLIPDVEVQALGADRHVIQSWSMDAPAATVAPGGEVPFHTEANASSAETIEDVHLQFTKQDPNKHAS